MPHLKVFSDEDGALRQIKSSVIFPIQFHAGIWILKQFYIYGEALCFKQVTQRDL